MNLKVLYEDNHIIVIDKPPGILSQGDSSGEESLLEVIKDYLKIKYSKPGNVFLGLVHRLDRPVSGVMVFARTSKAAGRLGKQFLAKSVSKYYLAIAQSKRLKKAEINAGDWNTMESRIIRKGDRTLIVEGTVRDSKSAILNFFPMEDFGDMKLLLIELKTGRKHQIRAQISDLLGSIPGDKKYGSNIEMGNSIALHAICLAIDHPVTNERMEFFSKIPNRFLKILGAKPESVMKKIKEVIDLRERTKKNPKIV